MHKVLHAALLVAALPIVMPAQETGATETQRTRNARPTGETKPVKGKRVSAERVRRFLRQNPRLQAEIKKKADANGDGKLDAAEKKVAYQMITERLARKRAQGQTGSGSGDAATDETRASRLDRNGDGKVGPAERKRAKQLRNRADRNDDGKVGPAERKRAKQLRNRADRNDDGKVGPAERKRAKQVRGRADRNGDGKVGPAERKRAQQVRGRKEGQQNRRTKPAKERKAKPVKKRKTNRVRSRRRK